MERRSWTPLRNKRRGGQGKRWAEGKSPTPAAAIGYKAPSPQLTTRLAIHLNQLPGFEKKQIWSFGCFALLQGAVGSGMVSEEQSVAEEGDCCSWMEAEEGKDGERRRKRFSQEQIKSLETMFETQTKLEPPQKLRLAGELGLQPRQVAIWFQNKRARWKAKQLEREYRKLKAEYDALLSSFDGLKKEKQLLLQQVRELSEMMEKAEEGSNRDGVKQVEHGLCAGAQPANSSLIVTEEPQFCSTATNWPSDQFLCSNPQWWEFWSSE
ncbi:homeobox-leucine zipper protein ATHB-12-like [Zingiber officinale]|uniref:Homeobox-leucine zipper protein n=1 Tax=Zingiber officinale TaxID=94328 RepID=A0A8J5G0T6_ZINOF|nr:homeobox-leucine zipper protein ATHB-12-like [Zingiber officinale]KAG6498843.1 hypothetical protein ZIOFF_038593 [Zingiber officinale]